MSYTQEYFPMSNVFKKAVRESKKDGRLRFVYATSSGYKMTLRRPRRDCVWVNGKEFGTWREKDTEGITKGILAD